MTARLPLMVFTDLDGTLIDHDTYTWAPAAEALNALNRLSAGIVLASSKTAAEVSTLRTTLGLNAWPAIVENGAGVLPPWVSDVQESARYDALRSALGKVPDDLRVLFIGFGDVTAEQVADMTALPVPDAALAQKRAFSEPGQWVGTDAQKATFLTHLAEHGITAQQGGRFLTLSFGGNKADQMRQIIRDYEPQHTIALGDAPNDVQMLEAADHAVVIANPHRPPLPCLNGEAAGRVIRTSAAGPSGWNLAILGLLQRLQLH